MTYSIFSIDCVPGPSPFYAVVRRYERGPVARSGVCALGSHGADHGPDGGFRLPAVGAGSGDGEPGARSERKVEHYVTPILAKLDVDSRTAAVTHAIA